MQPMHSADIVPRTRGRPPLVPFRTDPDSAVRRTSTAVSTAARIVVADGCGTVRLGVKSILERRPGWSVVAEAEDGEQAIEAVVRARPDVAVLEFSLRLFNGAEVARRIRQLSLPTEVLIFTMHDTEEIVRDTLQAGARGFLLKSDDREQLVSAVEALSRQRHYFSSKISDVLLEKFRQDSADTPCGLLTPRERQVVQLVSEGNSTKLVSARLGISPKTVETHRQAAMRKAGVACIAGLVRFAVRNKLVEA
jgi:DNA-binding NarL/FixJ family response regulator